MITMHLIGLLRASSVVVTIGFDWVIES